MKKLFTSESVTEGHPDKLCDLISDSILDAYLKEDENVRAGIETVAGKNTIFITGEVTSSKEIDIESVVRSTIKSIGYLGKQDIAEMYLRDAYESKGITKSKVPNEMAFSMRMGTILASIFYLIIAFMFYWFISPLAALIYSLITAFIIVYFLFSFPIN
jgi:hypothetical protein